MAFSTYDVAHGMNGHHQRARLHYFLAAHVANWHLLAITERWRYCLIKKRSKNRQMSNIDVLELQPLVSGGGSRRQSTWCSIILVLNSPLQDFLFWERKTRCKGTLVGIVHFTAITWRVAVLLLVQQGYGTLQRTPAWSSRKDIWTIDYSWKTLLQAKLHTQGDHVQRILALI